MMHKATCNECGQACEVPFKPNGRKPVFCSNCFKREEGPCTHALVATKAATVIQDVRCLAKNVCMKLSATPAKQL